MGEMCKVLPDYASQGASVMRGLDKVGIKNVEMHRKNFNDERVLTKQSAYVTLGNNQGAHMSRLIGVLNEFVNEPLAMDNTILNMLSDSHELTTAYWGCEWRSWHDTESGGFMFDAELEGIRMSSTYKWYITFSVPYASVCPCSHEMVKSVGHGVPHMQRSIVKVTGLLSEGDLEWLLPTALSKVAHVVDLVPESIMKRPDELAWCERAADINLFVEDSARNVAEVIDGIFDDWIVISEHQESIHQHNVLAVCKKGDTLV